LIFLRSHKRKTPDNNWFIHSNALSLRQFLKMAKVYFQKVTHIAFLKFKYFNIILLKQFSE